MEGNEIQKNGPQANLRKIARFVYVQSGKAIIRG